MHPQAQAAAAQWRVGKIHRVTLHACLYRSDSYFARNAWACQISLNGQWILDSPTQNALAHPVNLAMYLLGPTLEYSAQAAHVKAELYRAADIENYDTVSALITLDSRVEFLLLLTHACEYQVSATLRIEGERGHLVIQDDNIQWQAKDHTQQFGPDDLDIHANLKQLARVSMGSASSEMGMATLEVARAHTLPVNAISQASVIYTVPQEHRFSHHWEPDKYPGNVTAILGIELAFEHCARNFQMLHESGMLSYTQPAGTVVVEPDQPFFGPLRVANHKRQSPENAALI